MFMYIMRHGETDWNIDAKLQGQTDIELNEHGKQQAVWAAEALSDIKFDMVYSSPLRRAVETAKIVAKNQLDPIIDLRISEISFGEWEGLSSNTSENKEFLSELYKFKNDPFNFSGGPGGENIEQLCARTGDFCKQIMENKEYKDKNILIVSHGCAIKAMLYGISKGKEDFWKGGRLTNCELTKVEVKVEKIEIFDSKSQ